ncbi:MAG TPA: hypothetical protein VIR30_17715 [Nocardioides sp.]
MSTRSQANYCPYCGDADLRPHDARPGSWECQSCQRIFTLEMHGMIDREGSGA